MHPEPYLNKLNKLFLHAYPSTGTAKEIVESAGLDSFYFPENPENLFELWSKLIDIMAHQGHLRSLIRKALIDDTIREDYRKELDDMGQIMDVYEKLSSLLSNNLTGLSVDEVRAAYRNILGPTVNVEDLSRVIDDSMLIKEIVFTLVSLEYDKPKALLQGFIHEISALTADKNIQKAIREWLETAAGDIEFLQLDHAEWDNLPQVGIEKTSRAQRLIVSFEACLEDPDLFQVRIYNVDVDNKFEVLLEIPEAENTASGIPRAQIEQQVTEAIDFLRPGLDSDLVFIEFFLPRELMDLNPDQWAFDGNRLIEDFHIVAGSLERSKVITLQKMFLKLQRSPEKSDRDRALIEYRKLKKNKQWALVSAVNDWKKRWEDLLHDLGKPLADNVLEVDSSKTEDLEQLKLELKFGNLHCVLFTFDPYGLAHVDIQDLLQTLYVAGMPIIMWSRSSGAMDEKANSFKKYLVEEFKDYKIKDLDDLVSLIHDVRKNALLNFNEENHPGRSLNFIVDNPTRELPAQARNHL